MLILTLMLATSGPQDAGAMIAAAAGRLSVTCNGPDCAAPPSTERYRITVESGSALTSKDRAIGDDGSKCNVVGAQRCTRRGKTIFRTDLTD